MIDENSNIREYISLVKRGLEEKFLLKLQIDLKLANQSDLIFDLADIERRFFVEVKSLMKSVDPNNIIQQINYQKKVLNDLYPNEKIHHVLVFQNSINNKERENFLSQLNNNLGRQYVFDRADILNMIDNESTKNKNTSSRKINGQLYLVGSSWSGKDQTQRFIDESIWENGYDNRYLDIVNMVEQGDLLLMKSTFAQNSNSILRLKAYGIVQENLKDGRRIKINWKPFDNFIDIVGLGYYRDTITGPSNLDINTILEQILAIKPNFINIIDSLKLVKKSNVNLDKKLASDKEQEIKTTTTTIAGLSSDVDSGDDYLDISKDVNAFAKVIAAKSFKPPLAIALLGKWGSGKSFFMRKLMERIENLSESENQNAYCSGIAHVRFNAWSYMDSNLWAGIIAKIFEGLQEYIKNDTAASLIKDDVEKKITEKLNIVKEEIVDLEHQRDSIDGQIRTLELQKGQAAKTLQGKINEIKNKSLKKVLDQLDVSFNISTKIKDTLALNNSFNKSTEQFSKVVPEEYWQNPTELYKKVKSKYTFVKTFFKGASWKDNLACFFLILILVIIIKGVVFLANHFLNKVDFTIPTKTWYFITVIGGFIIRNIQTFKRLQPLISSFWKIKEDYELQKKDAIYKVNQAEKALKFEIENYKTEIQRINTQINQAEQSKLEIEYRLENTVTTEALFNFIEKRSISNDYKKHLGLVSIIRKDFEILSELFRGHHDEVNNSGDSEEFQKQFEKPLERIVLYIDDLDRCSDDRVVQVLEAVNLLMAYPLFVVVVGVDPRWVKNALIKKHELQFSSKSELESSEAIEPSGYLEKIFQVPFQLKAATDKSVKHMLKTLAESKPEIVVAKDESPEKEKEKEKEKEEGETRDSSNGGEDKKIPESYTKPDSETEEVITKETIESLKFSDKEIELLQSMSDILGTNPRALKRFVNIYRVIKAHEDFKYTNETEEGELLAVMFLIALPLGKYKKLVKPFENCLNIISNEDTNLHSFLNINDKNGKLKDKLMEILKLNNTVLIYQKIHVFQKHYSFIKRFTFNNL
ncbi:P-loop NTPase fold protein [Tenacibaculum ascidiaceicola]|uniref:P-loop NTPase fold protein n=1 Tax=Tenacibaculum ascidiaceicola TaxID=1699411 RepID=UPI003893C450